MTLEEFKTFFVKNFIGFDEEFAKDFFEKINQAYKDNIDAGVDPPLNDWYGTWKTSQGAPAVPLVWTGELRDGLALGEVTPEKVTIVNNAHVMLAWHAGDSRADGVPKRDPLPNDMIEQILQDCLNRMIERKISANSF